MKALIQIFLILVYLKSSLVYGQNQIKVKFKLVQSGFDIPGFVTPILISKNFEDYKSEFIKNRPDSTWLGKIVLDRDQYWHFLSLNGNDTVFYQQRIKNYKIETSQLINKHTKSYIGVLIIMFEKKKVIVLDRNNNHDFTDDVIITYPFEVLDDLKEYGEFEKQSTYKVIYERVRNEKVITNEEFVQIIPYQGDYKFNSDTLKKVSIFFKINSHFNGTISINTKSFEFCMKNQFSSGIFPNCENFEYSISKLDKKLNKFDWIGCQQEFKVENDIFRVDSLSLIDSIAYISHRESSINDYGWNINDYLDKSFFSNDIIQIKNDKKYYLIDFWGSWCSPCINEFPNIIDLQNNNPSLEIVSIACERNINDFSKSKMILEEKNIKWNSQFQILDDPKSLQRKLNVRTFPTTFVIDRTGRILSRVSGSGSITRLKKQLNLN